MATKKRAAAPAKKRQELELAREWQRWATENLLRGAPRAEVESALREEGVPSETSGPALDAILASPVFEAARPFARESRRYRTLARLHRALGKSSPRPTRIARLPFPGVDAFYERFVATSTPAIFPDLVPTWPAFGKWTPERLSERFGDVPIRITDGRDSDPDYDMNFAAHTREIPLSAYVDRVLGAGETNDFYMVANNKNLGRTALSAMLDDVALPEGLLLNDRLKDATALWLGPAGTVTPLHHDTSNIFFAQLVGRKRYRMIAPWEIAVLDGARSMYAGVDPEKPDLERYPWWPDVVVKDEVLAPGDALFIPVGWWHHVRALDVSISLAMNCFATPNRFDWFVPAQD
jgi:hypothetical protein